MKGLLWFVMVCLLVTSLTAFPAQAELFDGPVDRLPVLERVALRDGKVVITGENGKYVAKVLVEADPAIVWAVLTDYNHFAKFLPNIVSSKVLETTGNQKVVEQVSQQQVFIITVQARIRYRTTETEPTRIEFQLIEGDLSKLQGVWTLEPVAVYPGAKPTQILLTQAVQVAPDSNTPEDVFYNIFKNALADTLKAIRQEVLHRSP